MTSASASKKIFLTIGWLAVCLCISIIWLAVKEDFYTKVGSIQTSNPKTVALFFAALVSSCKVGLLLPFWFIWRKPKGGVHTWVAWVFGLLPVIGLAAAIIIHMLQPVSTPRVSSSEHSTAKQPQVASRPTYDSGGWTQESTGSTEVGPWLKYDPPGTRYCRYADRTIYRVYPPGVKPMAETANPFCVGDSTQFPDELP